jgi:hypothetical protein
MAFHFGNKLVRRKSAQDKSLQNSNAAMRIQLREHKKKKKNEE